VLYVASQRFFILSFVASHELAVPEDGDRLLPVVSWVMWSTAMKEIK
jgi:hypothetical protein